MPVEKRWYKFTRENVQALPVGLRGIYQLANVKKAIIDTGSSDSPRVGIRGRLLTHLRDKKYPTARYFRYLVAGTFDNPRDMETRTILDHARKHGHIPRYVKKFPKIPY